MAAKQATACKDCPLQKIEGLRPLEEQQLDYMQEFKQGEALIDDGDVLLTESEPHPHLYTLLDGVMIRYRSLEDGRRQIVNFMFPGSLVGLQGAFDEPLGHSIEALTPARLCRFARTRFTKLLSEHPRLGYDVIWLAATEETDLEGHLVALGQRTAKERVAYLAVWLLHRALQTGLAGKDNSIELPIRQAQIADMLGLSLVHTNRTLRALDKEGLVEWRPGEICIPDMERAAEFAQFELPEDSTRPFI